MQPHAPHLPAQGPRDIWGQDRVQEKVLQHESALDENIKQLTGAWQKTGNFKYKNDLRRAGLGSPASPSSLCQKKVVGQVEEKKAVQQSPAMVLLSPAGFIASHTLQGLFSNMCHGNATQCCSI